MKPTIVIITGLSGSGKTIALRALEDKGFFCVDNLPPQLINSFTEIEREIAKKIAISIDIREKEFLHKIEESLLPLRKKYNIEILFLEAETDVLIRRFKETRRPHPLSTDVISIESAIEMEVRLLKPLRGISDRIIDTSSSTPHQLRHLITTLYTEIAPADTISLTLISFGYKFGIPNNVDLLFDVRFLPNPYFMPELKELKGTDIAVKDFVLGIPETKEFIKRFSSLMDFLIPLYIKEGRAYLTLGIGCTGGRHRSPVITEAVAELMKKKPLHINIIHRDM